MDAKTLRKLTHSLAAGTLLGISGTAFALHGYVTDNDGMVVRDNFGDCVITEAWSPDDAIAACHPELVQTQQAKPLAAFEEPRKRVTRLINLESDTNFDFDEATLTDAGKKELDQLVQQIQGTQDQRVKITGYTDRIGPESYNQDLSKRRADAVKQYLMDKGIPAEAIQVSARGESNPVVSCEGIKGEALIECLRPNRRSEVEFSAFEVVDEEGGQQMQQQSPTQDEEGM